MKKRMITLMLCGCMAFAMAGCGEKPQEQPDGREDQDPADDGESKDPQPDGTGDGTVVYTGTPVKFMAYNIYYLNMDERQEDVLNLIRRESPDVLFLQEVSQGWLPYIRGFLETDGYSCYGFGRYGSDILSEEQKSGDAYTPVLWKTEKYELIDSGHFWLSSTPEVEGTAAWTDGTVSSFPRCCNWVKLKDKETGASFFAMPMHLAPEGGAVRPNGCRMLVSTLGDLSGGLPIIMGGDYNFGLTENSYEILVEGGFVDTRFAAENTTNEGSFNNFGQNKGGESLFCDYIFTSQGLQVETFAVVEDLTESGDHASDHNPVTAVIYVE